MPMPIKMPIKANFQTPRFRSFHAIAALRGDGLRPELVQLFERLAKGADDANISGTVEASKGCEPDCAAKNAAARFAKQSKADICGAIRSVR